MSSRHTLRLIALLAVLGIVATACLGGDAETTADDAADVLAFDDADLAPDTAGDTDGPAATSNDDVPCEGGAFPGDDEFREALCAAQFAQVDVLRAGGEVDESWGPRLADAILAYADDRDGALAELAAIAAEAEAAAAAADG